MSSALITKHRPTKLEEVVGHPAVVKSLKNAAAKKLSSAYLFSGPPGTGKTTLARLVAQLFGVLPADIIEVDGASTTGIDDMRQLAEGLMYRPLGGGMKAVIVDECQGISKAGVSSLLKVLEEPPAHVVWALCTTELGKIPKAIQTRCTHYALQPVSVDDLFDLLVSVADKEKYKTADPVLELCAVEAEGSPRQALVNLSVCVEAKNAAEAKTLLRSAVDSSEAVELARALLKGASWKEVQKLLGGLQVTNAESVRHVVRAYVTTVGLRETSEARVGRALEVLDVFSEPFNSADGISPVLLACGKLILSGKE